MTEAPLDERSKGILFEIVNEHIQKAEPVGSRCIAKKYFEKLSAATIRNVMSDLEDLGYLKQPHTSAGRVPTDKGYRFYVDNLLGPQNLLKEIKSLTADYEYPPRAKNLQEVLETACGILSQNSNQAGLVMLPSFSCMPFKQIEFFKVGRNQVLAVFHSEMGVLQNKIIPIDPDTSQEELSSISHYLNEEFSGRSLRVIREEILRRLKHERDHYNRLMKKAMDLSARVFAPEENEAGNLLVDGVLNFFDKPEFADDLNKIKSLIQTLQEKTKLVKLLDLCLKHDDMTVLIGQENADEEMHGCSLIAQNYQLGKEKLGTLAIFGPKRMDYKKVIWIVNDTAKTVSQLISKKFAHLN